MKKFLLAAVLAASGIADADAAPLIWTLHDVEFGDGAAAAGWFVFDSDSGTFGDFAITTSAGTHPAFTAATYSSSNSSAIVVPKSLTPGDPGTLYVFGTNSGDRQLRIARQDGLSANGGSVTLIGTSRTGECTRDCVNGRVFSNAGSITSAAVPEPATWAMMLLGFGMVGAAVRRRRQHVSVSFA